MKNHNFKTTVKVAAITVLTGSICMIGGAALMGISGADLDKALDENDLANYLAAAKEGRVLLILNLTLWICGVFLIGLAGTLMANLSDTRKVISKIIIYNYSIAIPIVVIAYSAWFAIVVRLSAHDPQDSAVLAEVVGWFASRADWIATILVLGTGPFLITLSGRDNWGSKMTSYMEFYMPFYRYAKSNRNVCWWLNHIRISNHSGGNELDVCIFSRIIQNK